MVKAEDRCGAAVSSECGGHPHSHPLPCRYLGIMLEIKGIGEMESDCVVEFEIYQLVHRCRLCKTSTLLSNCFPDIFFDHEIFGMYVLLTRTELHILTEHSFVNTFTLREKSSVT